MMIVFLTDIPICKVKHIKISMDMAAIKVTM